MAKNLFQRKNWEKYYLEAHEYSEKAREKVKHPFVMEMHQKYYEEYGEYKPTGKYLKEKGGSYGER